MLNSFVLRLFPWCRGAESNCGHADFQTSKDDFIKSVIPANYAVSLAFFVPMKLDFVRQN